MPIFESTKDEHLFYRELLFWGFPDVHFLQKRLKFPHELVDMFQLPPTQVEESMVERWRKLGPLNLYDMVTKNATDKMSADEPDFDENLKISLIEDQIKIYYGQVDSENKRNGFGRYISLFNGSIYEGNCRNGQQNGYGRLIQGLVSVQPQLKAQVTVQDVDSETPSAVAGAPPDKPDVYVGFWREGLRHGYGK